MLRPKTQRKRPLQRIRLRCLASIVTLVIHLLLHVRSGRFLKGYITCLLEDRPRKSIYNLRFGTARNRELFVPDDDSRAPRRKALLVSCTYEGVATEDWGGLKNGFKDIDTLKSLLFRAPFSNPIDADNHKFVLLLGFGFLESEITVLSDKPEHGVEYPTRENIVRYPHR